MTNGYPLFPPPVIEIAIPDLQFKDAPLFATLRVLNH